MKRALKIIIVFIVILGLVASYVMLGLTTRRVSTPAADYIPDYSNPSLNSNNLEQDNSGFTGPTGDNVIPNTTGPSERPPDAN